MVHFLQCSISSSSSSNAHMILHLLPLFFFFSSITLLASMEVPHSDARMLPLRLLEISTNYNKEDESSRVVEMVRMEGRGLIGSRPPRCERVCISCGHCEAVQVPTVPQDHHHKRAGQEHHHPISSDDGGADAAAMPMLTTSYSVDYKPLSWKCKCGGIILDP